MIDGPIGQKWVCAAGVERSTLHRCGLTGLGGQMAALVSQAFVIVSQLSSRIN